MPRHVQQGEIVWRRKTSYVPRLLQGTDYDLYRKMFLGRSGLEAHYDETKGVRGGGMARHFLVPEAYWDLGSQRWSGMMTNENRMSRVYKSFTSRLARRIWNAFAI